MIRFDPCCRSLRFLFIRDVAELSSELEYRDLSFCTSLHKLYPLTGSAERLRDWLASIPNLDTTSCPDVHKSARGVH